MLKQSIMCITKYSISKLLLRKGESLMGRSFSDLDDGDFGIAISENMDISNNKKKYILNREQCLNKIS